RATGLAGMDPLLMMPKALRNGGRRALEVAELILRKQGMLSVIGEDHALASDEEDAAVPLRNATVAPDRGFHLSLVPGQLQGRTIPARSILVSRRHAGRRDLRMRRRS